MRAFIRPTLTRPAAIILVCILAFFIAGYANIWFRDRFQVHDFDILMVSGRSLAAGLDPYATYLEGPNRNPPITLPLFQLFGRVDRDTAYQGWVLFSGLIYLAGVVWLIKTYPDRLNPLRLVWALSLYALFHELIQGQIYALLFLLTTAAWILQDHGHPRGAGFFIGLLAALKPNFLVWPALLLLSTQRRVGFVAILTFLLTSALPILLYGPGIYAGWLAILPSPADLTNLESPTLFTAAAILGVPSLGLWLSLFLLAITAFWALRFRPSAHELGSTALIVAMLASPIAWVGYWLVWLPAIWPSLGDPRIRACAALMVVPMQWFKVLPGGWSLLLAVPILLAVSNLRPRPGPYSPYPRPSPVPISSSGS